MFLELLALSVASDASSNAAAAKNAATGPKGSGSFSVFIKFTDYQLEDESANLFFTKYVLKPVKEITLNISNIEYLEDGIQDSIRFTKIRTFSGSTFYSIKTQDEIQQLIMTEFQNLAKLFKDA